MTYRCESGESMHQRPFHFHGLLLAATLAVGCNRNSFGPDVRSPTPPSPYSLGSAYLEEGELDQAVQSLKAAASDLTYDARASYRLGRAYQLRGAPGDLDLALANYSDAIERDVQFHQAYRARGEIFRSLGFLRPAIHDFQAAAAIHGLSSDYIAIARARIAQGAYSNAVGAAEEAIRMAPDDVNAYLTWIVALAAEAAPQDLVAAVDRLRALAPAEADRMAGAVCYYSAAQAAELGRNRSSEITLAHAVALLPDWQLYDLNDGEEVILLASRDDVSVAAKVWTPFPETLTLSEQEEAAQQLLVDGLDAFRLGEWSDAVAHFDEALAADVDALTIHHVAHTAKSVQIVAASDAYSDDTPALPSDAEQALENGKTAFAAKRWDDALLELSRAIELDDELSEAYYFRGRAFLAINNPENALTNLQNAMALGRRDADVYLWRGTAQDALGQAMSARRDFTLAIDLDPTYAPAYFARGQLLAEMGKRELAANDLRQAVSLAPSSASYRAALDSLLAESAE